MIIIFNNNINYKLLFTVLYVMIFLFYCIIIKII
nr:MAG TPA: hypothetical protein [Caudoviricetes sp.]